MNFKNQSTYYENDIQKSNAHGVVTHCSNLPEFFSG
jgi:hypothetical protein